MSFDNLGDKWSFCNAVSSGGTVSGGVASADGKVWLVTEAGLLRGEGDNWFPSPVGPPLSNVQAVAASEATVIVGGEGGTAYSMDDGKTWFRGASDETFVSVTCLAKSPSWQRDGGALAGTNGTGIVRSSDGGRSWQASSFGLKHPTILSLATAPVWTKREIVFAATVDSFYRSASGGRAWKSIDLGPDAGSAQDVAFSPAFAEDGTILVGTESGGIFRSVDGGESWTPWGVGIGSPAGSSPINALWFCPDRQHLGICLAATADGTIFRSKDGGAIWSEVSRVGTPVLCLFEAHGTVYAGLNEDGFVVSTDLGKTWQFGRVAARGFARLVAGRDATHYASGPLTGLWYSEDGGNAWNEIESPREASVIHALGIAPDYSCLLAGTSQGLFVSDDAGRTWLGSGVSDQVHVIAFAPRFANNHRIYIGTHQGSVACSRDGGMSWDTQSSSTTSGPVVAIAELPSTDDQVHLVKVSFDALMAQLIVWHRTESEEWEPWLRSSAHRGEAHLAVDSEHQVVVACLDRACWRFSEGHWAQMLTVDTSFLGIEHRQGAVGFVAFTDSRFYQSVDGKSWVSWFDGPPGAPLVDAAFSWEGIGGTVRALAVGGTIWQQDLPAITVDATTSS